jgi:hypothetical protein
MRELALLGFICAAFGLGAYRGTGELGLFGGANLVLGFGSLGVSALLALRAWRRRRRGSLRGPLLDALVACIALLWAAVLLEGFANASQVRFDWTFEARYALAPATVQALENLPQRMRVTLYSDQFDPRARRTMLLLKQLERHGDVLVRKRLLGQVPEEEDLFGIRSSNSVVLEVGERWERVERPGEGAIFEAVSYLGSTDSKVLYLTAGAGEGDVTKSEPLGYSGVAAALETEGYEVRRLGSPSMPRIPEDASAVVLLAPERRLQPSMLNALSHYLHQGGSLIAMLEPGEQSGLEELLAEFGLNTPDKVIIDPASGSVNGEPPGLDPIVFNYAEHPVTKGLERNRQTYFRGARSFRLVKPRPEDDLRSVVYASGESWLCDDPSVLKRRVVPRRPQGARADYHPIAVAGLYRRDQGETRIVAFGDSDFASNQYLRALYNLDLVMNAVHWATRRESRISIRPKAGQLIQFPLPIQNSLRAFYGIGLLVPQLLLMAGGLVWLRRRTA